MLCARTLTSSSRHDLRMFKQASIGLTLEPSRHPLTSCASFSQGSRSLTYSSSHSACSRSAFRIQQSVSRKLVKVSAAGANPSEDDGEDDDAAPRGRQRGRGQRGRGPKKEDDDGPKLGKDGFTERVLQVSRVTKVVKGGKQMSFRAVVAVGTLSGSVGVGCSSAKEIMVAVEKAVVDAKRHVINVPITRGLTFPHAVTGIGGSAKVMLRPASEGTGVIAGGAVREVLELAGIQNAFGKQLGSDNPLNNARATVDGLLQMRTLSQAAKDRDLTVEQMLSYTQDKAVAAA